MTASRALSSGKAFLVYFSRGFLASAIRANVLKPVMTRLGPVLVPGARGRALLGRTRYYTPKPAPLEVAVLVRRQAEAMQREGYMVLRREGSRALLERDGERVLVVGVRGSYPGKRPKPRDALEASATRVLVLVPEGARKTLVEAREVPLEPA